MALAEQGRARGPEATVDHPLMRGLGTAGPDTSWSCLGLGPSVGGIRLLVWARVLLSGAARPALLGGGMRYWINGTSAMRRV